MEAIKEVAAMVLETAIKVAETGIAIQDLSQEKAVSKML